MGSGQPCQARGDGSDGCHFLVSHCWGPLSLHLPAAAEVAKDAADVSAWASALFHFPAPMGGFNPLLFCQENLGGGL